MKFQTDRQADRQEVACLQMTEQITSLPARKYYHLEDDPAPQVLRLPKATKSLLGLHQLSFLSRSDVIFTASDTGN